MRDAPKWRRGLPTSREIRFALTMALERRWPAPLRRVNLHLTEAEDAAVPPAALLRWTRGEDAAPMPAPDDLPAWALELQRRGGIWDERSFSGMALRLHPGGRVLGHSGQAVDPASGLSLSPVNRNRARPAAGLRARSLPGVAINFLDLRADRWNHYHVLLDNTVDRLAFLARAADRWPGATILLSPTRNRIEEIAAEAYLSRFPGMRIETVARDERIDCEFLLQPRIERPTIYRSPADAAELADLMTLFAAWRAPAPTGRRLLVSRKDARLRRLTNEDALAEALAPHGYEVATPGALPLEEQIRLFSEAERVIGVHGAGLTNIAFMHPGGRVTELFGADYVQGAYRWLSHLGGLSHGHVIAAAYGAHQSFTLSPAEMDRAVALAVA